MPGSSVQSGTRPQDVYFVRETTGSDNEPATPADPSFLLYSSVVSSMETSSNSNYDERTGLGNYLPQDKTRQQEDHEVTVAYDLERFPTDSGGNAQDALYDASKRNTDNQIADTHTVLHVETHETIGTNQTVHYQYFTEGSNTHPATDNGASSVDTRIEDYTRGAIPEEVSLSLDPGESAAAAVEIQYMAYKRRVYQFDQPSAEFIHVRSSDTGDTTQTVTIETVDGSQSEDLSLNGQTVVASSSTFDSLRVSLDTETAGTVEVYGDDGSGSGSAGSPDQLLTIIRGSSDRSGVEGDLGVPELGAGSFETVSGAGTLGDGIPAAAAQSITFDGTNVAEQISSTSMTVTNELEDITTGEGLTKAIYGGGQEIVIEGTVFGETESPQQFGSMLEGTEGAFVIPLSDGDITLARAYCRSGGEFEREEGSAVMQTDVTWSALDPASGDALTYNNTT